MMRPPADWIEKLPRDRCIAEFSMWSANLMNLEGDLNRISPFADILHLDVADGHFAPSLLFFPDLVAALREVTAIPLHVHLMASNDVLIEQIADFSAAGADLISVHVENAELLEEAFSELNKHGVAKGLVLRVETPIDEVAPYIEDISFLTLLGTAIGVKGQGLDRDAVHRLQQARSLKEQRTNPARCVLAADGGIRDQTVPGLIANGAETVVLGSLAFGADDLQARMSWLGQLGR